MEVTRTVPLQLLTLAQASVMVNLSKRTLRRAIDAGRLHAHHLGRSIRIDREELARWVKANGAAPVSDASAAR